MIQQALKRINQVVIPPQSNDPKPTLLGSKIKTTINNKQQITTTTTNNNNNK